MQRFRKTYEERKIVISILESTRLSSPSCKGSSIQLINLGTKDLLREDPENLFKAHQSWVFKEEKQKAKYSTWYGYIGRVWKNLDRFNDIQNSLGWVILG